MYLFNEIPNFYVLTFICMYSVSSCASFREVLYFHTMYSKSILVMVALFS